MKIQYASTLLSLPYYLPSCFQFFFMTFAYFFPYISWNEESTIFTSFWGLIYEPVKRWFGMCRSNSLAEELKPQSWLLCPFFLLLLYIFSQVFTCEKWLWLFLFVLPFWAPKKLLKGVCSSTYRTDICLWLCHLYTRCMLEIQGACHVCQRVFKSKPKQW